MERKKNNGFLIGVLVGIIVMLLVFIGLLVTNTISFSSKSDASDKLNNGSETRENTVNDESNSNNRDSVVSLLKTTLSNQEWVNENLYSKENCFGSEVGKDKQELKFEVLSDNNNNPMIIVSDYSFDDFVVACYRVYVNNGQVLVNRVGSVGHPSHGGFSVDKNQGIVAYNYGHQGNYAFIAYNVKDNNIKESDRYSCNTGDCVYEYKGDKEYNLSDISIKFTNDNISTYVK